MTQPDRPNPSPQARTASRSRRRGFMAVVGAVALATALTACSGGSGSSSNKSASGQSTGEQNVSVRTDVFFSGATLPLIVAKQNGYFAKNGLNVTINPGKGSATTLQTVANGSDNIGYADAGVLIQLAAKGASVEMIADMVQKSPLEVVTLAKSGITSPQQLKGLTGGYVDGSAGEQLWPAFAAAVGLSPTDVKFVHVDIPTRDSLLVTGQTKFSFGLSNNTEPLISTKCDCQVQAFHYSDYGINMLSSGIVTSPAYAKANPDTLRKFLTALSEATAWATQNPDQAVTAFMAGAGKTTLTPQVVKQQWLNSIALLHSKRTEGQPFGCMSAQDWADSVQLMAKYVKVNTAAFDTAKLWSNDYLTGCSS